MSFFFKETSFWFDAINILDPFLLTASPWDTLIAKFRFFGGA